MVFQYTDRFPDNGHIRLVGKRTENRVHTCLPGVSMVGHGDIDTGPAITKLSITVVYEQG